MLHTELASPSRGVGREYWQRFLILGLLAVTTAPAWAADKAKDEETLRNASTVLSAMLESNNVPADLLARAYCVVVLPGVKKFGFGVGGSGGRADELSKGKVFQRQMVCASDVHSQRRQCGTPSRGFFVRLRAVGDEAEGR